MPVFITSADFTEEAINYLNEKKSTKKISKLLCNRNFPREIYANRKISKGSKRSQRLTAQIIFSDRSLKNNIAKQGTLRSIYVSALYILLIKFHSYSYVEVLLA